MRSSFDPMYVHSQPHRWHFTLMLVSMSTSPIEKGMRHPLIVRKGDRKRYPCS
ncbi:MAG: hypothetical protein LUQ33_00085 [Methanoregulaceae archaeon]|nr:hypothetical protein [Methanoregulaceae archaeon]